ncbi:MAG: serine hydrolase [Clostridiales Family XIII bacterium]|nr:serine hydrolase [Clostridiales Family XIII bacterium]
MSLQPARGERPSARPVAASPAVPQRRAVAAKQTASPRRDGDWNAFLVSRAEVLSKAKSARRRRFVVFFIIFFLVFASEPIREYASERYPYATLSSALVGSKAYIKEIPRKFMNVFVKDGNERPSENESSSEGFGGSSDANSSFSVASLHSSAAILANFDTGSVLLKKNADIMVYPASLTKIMTVLIALERRDALPYAMVIDPGLLQPLYDADSTMAGFLPGEEVRTLDLMYGALLVSGGECSVTLAEAIAGSEENFAVLMNERARELGMLDTHFTNSTGLHDPEHYSTVRDMAKLLLRALENEEFEEMFTTVEYETSPSNLRGYGITMTNNIFARIRTVEFDGGRILGGKTGWTGDAGQCLASFAEKDGNRYIFVSTGNGVEPNGVAYNFEDALNAYENAIRRH